MSRTLVAAFALTLAMGATAQAATNLVSNPSFESPNAGHFFASDWGHEYFYWDNTPGVAHSGDYFVATACVGPIALEACFIEQTLTTTAGASYDVALWTKATITTIGSFEVTWNGTRLGPVEVQGGQDWTWHQFSFNNLVATGASTVLRITGRNDPATMYFDDVSASLSPVVSPGVPEPATWAMMILGFGSAGVALRRRRIVA